MNKWVKLLIAGLAAALVFLGALMLANVTRSKAAPVTVSGVDIQFTDSLQFVCADDIKDYIAEGYGTLAGERTDSVRLWEIESLLESKSAIGSCEAWTTADGVLHLLISQRAPAVRFKCSDGSGWYIDDRGYIFPLHSSYTATVPVVEGKIPVKVAPGYKGEAQSEKERQWLSDIVAMENCLSGSKQWKGRLDKVTVADNGDLQLQIEGGKEIFIFGDPSDAAAKASLMEKYCSYILPAVGEGFYKSVNLKYNNQIICRKDI